MALVYQPAESEWRCHKGLDVLRVRAALYDVQLSQEEANAIFCAEFFRRLVLLHACSPNAAILHTALVNLRFATAPQSHGQDRDFRPCVAPFLLATIRAMIPLIWEVSLLEASHVHVAHVSSGPDTEQLHSRVNLLHHQAESIPASGSTEIIQQQLPDLHQVLSLRSPDLLGHSQGRFQETDSLRILQGLDRNLDDQPSPINDIGEGQAPLYGCAVEAPPTDLRAPVRREGNDDGQAPGEDDIEQALGAGIRIFGRRHRAELCVCHLPDHLRGRRWPLLLLHIPASDMHDDAAFLAGREGACTTSLGNIDDIVEEHHAHGVVRCACDPKQDVSVLHDGGAIYEGPRLQVRLGNHGRNDDVAGMTHPTRTQAE
mmetsp:Transcript_16032/g.42159  ORF Transcript_16032/g.42159 Transcript_16032/m.42159 type:complete len:372 (-) Transcript_16032:509-1624(-)